MTISISNMTVNNNMPAGTVVGVLTTRDSAGNVVPCNYILYIDQGFRRSFWRVGQCAGYGMGHARCAGLLFRLHPRSRHDYQV